MKIPARPGWTIREWREVTATQAGVRSLGQWVSGLDPTDPAWICLAPPDHLAAQLERASEQARSRGLEPRELPLFGVPFAVKDNIDVAGLPTTAACPAFAYTPARSARVVQALQDLGAVAIGKTNLDQFATGLSGTRSPYGVVPCVFDEARIGGGSSSGSARVVSLGILPFALGTDTAGSGRVPAALQNIVGLKPTRGRWSTAGVVPACRTLDCVSVFTLTTRDARMVAEAIEGFDPQDPYSRRLPARTPRSELSVSILGYPRAPEFFGDTSAASAFEATLEHLRRIGLTPRPIDFTPFSELAALLYGGPWVVERVLVAEAILRDDPGSLDPAVRSILEANTSASARDAFLAEYERARLSRAIDSVFDELDALVVPTVPTHYSIREVLESPIETNSRLGTYTNFTNLADLCALAVPGTFRGDGLPSGITLLGRAFEDERLLALAATLERSQDLPLGGTGRRFASVSSEEPHRPFRDGLQIAVLGAHMSGMPLCHQLTERGASLVRKARTATCYELFILPRQEPQKPALRRSLTGGGQAIELELWQLPSAEVAGFLGLVSAPLGLGKVELEDGSWVSGFICEPWGFEGAEDITHLGGFRAYLATVQES